MGNRSSDQTGYQVSECRTTRGTGGRGVLERMQRRCRVISPVSTLIHGGVEATRVSDTDETSLGTMQSPHGNSVSLWFSFGGE